MKKILLVLLTSSLFACQNADQNAVKEQVKADSTTVAQSQAVLTTIGWPDSTYKDLGKIKDGQIVEVSFRFKNTGNANLVIEDVTASCGCTIPEKPEKPFAPGEEGVIRAKFDSKNRKGEARKNVYVKSNTGQATQELSFRVEVIE